MAARVEHAGRWNRAARGAGMARRAGVIAALAALLMPLAGCLYPEEETPGNDASARQAVIAVQDAVDRYLEDKGVLPIVSADDSVPVYEKFKVDLGKLKRTGYLGSIPQAAFESGGRDQFLVIDEETKPAVKLLDIPIYQQTQDIQAKVDDYRDKHGGALPAGEAELHPGYRALDFKKLGGKEPVVRSMYSGQTLTYMVDEGGAVFLDYAPDIASAVRKAGTVPAGSEDLRRVLVDASYFVPVKSPAYHWVNEEPVPVESAP